MRKPQLKLLYLRFSRLVKASKNLHDAKWLYRDNDNHGMGWEAEASLKQR
jgi:hypothetical protein